MVTMRCMTPKRMQTVKVSLGPRSYPIHIGVGLLKRIGAWCEETGLGRRCVVISDRRVAPLYGHTVLRSLRERGFEVVPITVPSGESTKCLDVVGHCYRKLAAHRIERSSFVVALGGGVVGDLAGFVAATYLRGLAYVQVPTTLLAQVDSSVGGKVGINLKEAKNLVGAFHQPRLVVCDLATLATLPAREYRSGLAEVIKYGIIRDATLFALLERRMGALVRRDRAWLGPVVARSCAIKAQVVGKDELEGGPRAILNYGHTLGHAIEATSGYGTWLHGEAVAVGMIAAARLSRERVGLPEASVERIHGLVASAGLPTGLPPKAANADRLLRAMALDKKAAGGEVRFVLNRRIGQAIYGQRVPTELVRQEITRLTWLP
jgi:3-dehydroquinate synthase